MIKAGKETRGFDIQVITRLIPSLGPSGHAYFAPGNDETGAVCLGDKACKSSPGCWLLPPHDYLLLHLEKLLAGLLHPIRGICPRSMVDWALSGF